VAYHTEGKPVKGNGWNVAEYEGVTYLFANKKNRKMFEADPEKYLPAYGGYCAYGVAIGKKFAIDPEVWKIENGKLYLNLDTGIQKKWAKDIPGKLYLNLDTGIQKKWAKDIPGYIKKADANWPEIKEKAPSDL
jgi:YHS domain-containing protein